MIYNIYLILKNFKKEFYSFFFKSLTSFFIRSKIKILSIIDYGEMIFFKKNNKRLFSIIFYCNKILLIKILKLFNLKKESISFFIVLKKKINFYIENIFKIKNFLSQKFLILPSIINKINYKLQKKICKIIKILRIFGVIPNTLNKYIKKIKKILC
ncbi:putative ribosomal protein s18 [Candidatus Carsonella ruddii CS isolate Thao2000]|uniref:Putative ribosomal protein s18 n=1 Tax=Candidatus Carsonella ruddii CS isolate Thao2000 TaxID=1202537 RepID=J7GWB6_CARRU|nr:hypothetical protein [Candidatus Carsonella ruddii]AFP83726.1 putative ribosomal protein s18 [Candidatus Carsonella ruddii CS isolate Thao2000]